MWCDMESVGDVKSVVCTLWRVRCVAKGVVHMLWSVVCRGECGMLLGSVVGVRQLELEATG